MGTLGPGSESGIISLRLHAAEICTISMGLGVWSMLHERRTLIDDWCSLLRGSGDG